MHGLAHHVGHVAVAGAEPSERMISGHMQLESTRDRDPPPLGGDELGRPFGWLSEPGGHGSPYASPLHVHAKSEAIRWGEGGTKHARDAALEYVARRIGELTGDGGEGSSLHLPELHCKNL